VQGSVVASKPPEPAVAPTPPDPPLPTFPAGPPSVRPALPPPPPAPPPAPLTGVSLDPAEQELMMALMHAIPPATPSSRVRLIMQCRIAQAASGREGNSTNTAFGASKNNMDNKLHVGDEAPDFVGTTQGGATIRLSDYRGRCNVVLYFYPKDFTAGCTSEACMFRDAYDEFKDQDTEVIGVSLDALDTHEQFAAKHGLRFPLVSDHDGRIARSYGALGGLRAWLGAAKRLTYGIDKQGRIRGVFHHELQIGQHVRRVRELLDQQLRA
jgi:thioredoxin-dependent peroxiredoxin